MISLLSYIYPITKKIQSKYNGIVEITWFRGKKLLDTKNTNYSYGSLEKILEKGLEHIDFKYCNNILLLGLGGGSVIKTLRNKIHYTNNITAVDIDPIIIQIAKNEYNIHVNNALEIICDDAYTFVLNNTKQYDFIIIDLFLDDKIPKQFFKDEFWINILHAKQILFNASLYEKNEPQLKNLVKFLKKHNFNIKTLYKVNKTNTLLIINKY